VLFFLPTTVNVVEGEEFETTLELSNPAARPFEQVWVTLLYNASAIEPLGFKPVRQGRQSELNDVRDLPERGLIQIGLEFPSVREDLSASFLTIRWRARREVRSTQVIFMEGGDEGPFVGLVGGGSILGSPHRVASGLIDATVRVHPNYDVDLIEDGDGVTLPHFDLGISEELPEGGIGLRLVPRREALGVGEVIDVDVVIDNPEAVRADSVTLFVEFDPQTLRVIDTHDGNWIERHVNIWDGGYHLLFPFDVHLANHADNERGSVHYSMGFTEEMPLPSGVIATIRFQALQPSRDLTVQFNPEWTSVRFLGEDLLGDPLTPDDGMVGLRLNVSAVPVARGSARPEPVS
jgi:hypothetical protein